MLNIYGYTLEDLEGLLINQGYKKYNAKQIYDWLYTQYVDSFDQMTNIKKEMIESLKTQFQIEKMPIIELQVSKDGTRKYLFELNDGQLIETVLMEYEHGYSVCVTSQVGCNMGCSFCASGQRKKVRDLTAGEMVQQVMMVQQDLKSKGLRVSHIVVMGIGEPFDNYDHLMKFITIINHPHGLAIGARHITVSTSGLVPRIYDYAKEPFQTNLAISLHAPNDEIRNQMMPISKVYPIDELMEAVRDYIKETNRRVTFEYILLEGKNDQPVHARELAKLIRGLNCYVNLIPYNKVDESGYIQTNKKQVLVFYDLLKKEKINVTIRKEHGSDIDAACGQLRSKKRG